MDKENTNVDEQQKMLTIMSELVELGKKKENVLELSEIEKVFADQGMELDDDKTEKVFEYLENKGIVAMVPESDTEDDIILDVEDEPTQKVVYIIRRLTPVEGERLQGYPDDWTKYGADGNIIADTARYRAIGNSICVYCAERLYIGIIRILQEEEKDNERKDESLL